MFLRTTRTTQNSKRENGKMGGCRGIRTARAMRRRASNGGNLGTNPKTASGLGVTRRKWFENESIVNSLAPYRLLQEVRVFRLHIYQCRHRIVPTMSLSSFVALAL